MNKPKIRYALDIGNNAIKFIKFHYLWNGPEVMDARIHNLPQDFLSLPTEREKVAALVTALDVLLSGEDISEKEIVVTLPADLTVVRYITLPNIPPSKIDKIIRFEAEQQIPLPFAEVEWSYLVLPLRKKREVDVVITATRKEVVHAITDKLRQFNFYVTSFETGQLMLANLAQGYGYDKSGTILLDLGAKSVHVIMFFKGALWGRTLRFGMFKMTRVISERLHVSMTEAEALKKRYVFSKENGSATNDAVSPEQDRLLHSIEEDVLYEIVNEVSRTISYYLSVMRGAVFSTICVTGGGANIKGVTQFFEKNLGIQTEIADFTKRITLHSHLQDRFGIDKNYYSVALGAAHFYSGKQRLSTNLISEKIREERVVGVYKRRYIFFFAILLCSLVMILLALKFECGLKESKVDKLQTFFNGVQESERSLKKIEKNLVQKGNRLLVVEQGLEERVRFTALLGELQKELPDDVWFESLHYDRKNHTLMLSGKTTGTLEVIHTFRDSLHAISFVKEVKFDAASIEEETHEDLVLRYFSLTIGYEA